MNKWTLLSSIAVVSAIAACSKDRPAESPEGTMPPGEAGTTSGAVDVDSLRMTLLREYPHKADEIRALSISENGGLVTLSGTVYDETLPSQLVGRVRQMPGVRDVDNRLRTQPRMGQNGGQQASSQTVEEVRVLMLQERPNDSDIVRGLAISEDGGIVTLRGRVYDEQMKSDLTRAAKKARGVRDVKDDMQVDQGMNGAGSRGASGDGNAQMQKGASAESIRSTLMREQPKQSSVIESLKITEQGDAIVLRGTVPDQKTKKQIVDAAKKAAGQKTIRDELDVKK